MLKQVKPWAKKETKLHVLGKDAKYQQLKKERYTLEHPLPPKKKRSAQQ